MKIYVGNLSYDTQDDELRRVFEEFGPVTDCTILLDRETGRSRGFGFVEMANAPDAQKAINELNGAELHGRNLKVNEARPKPDRGDGGGGGGRRRY